MLGAAIAICCSLVLAIASGQATSGGSPYDVPGVVDTDPAPDVVETTLVAKEATVDLGGGVTARAQTFNGQITGPTFRLDVGDTVVVHFVNELARPSGIHWHGIELSNGMDGTPFTQNQVAPGGSFIYRFKVTRPGIYWYHPHNHSSTDQVFKGLHGMIVVSDPNEVALRQAGTLPPESQTRQIVLSDTTVCKAPGQNDSATYDPALPHVSGTPLAVQQPPTPEQLCEDRPIDEDGVTRGAFAAGDIPNVLQAPGGEPVNEGQTLLTNGRNVGARAGTPDAPGALAPGASTLPVEAGQGLRLQFVNTAVERYMRLRLTTATGALVPLVRVGGEGGLLNAAVVEGGIVDGFDTQYDRGEIVLAPGNRADVVAAIPASAAGTLTLWTEDFKRVPSGYTNTPTVPVMHLEVTGTASSTYTIDDGTPLRSATGRPLVGLPAPTATLLDPATFANPKPGLASQAIQFQSENGNFVVDDTLGTHDSGGDYRSAPHLGSTRWAKEGDVLELTVRNATSFRHPFHLHGFSFQPLSLTSATGPAYTWPYVEYRDTLDLPPGYTLRYRVRLDARALPDGSTPGGAEGRWMFHCHIFQHAEDGMLSEISVASPSGNERPDVDADQTLVEVDQPDPASATGTFQDPDGDPVTLTASEGEVTKDAEPGHWTWTPAADARPGTRFVYVTATDSLGQKAQTPFVVTVTAAPPPPPPPPPPPDDGGGGGGSGGGGGGGSGGGGGGGSASGGGGSGSGGGGSASGGSVGGAASVDVAPGAARVAVDRRQRLARGTVLAGCRLGRGSLRRCDVSVYDGRRRVGKGHVELGGRGTGSTIFRVRLDRRERRSLAAALGGRRLSVHARAQGFGSSTTLEARARTMVLAPRASALSRRPAFLPGVSSLSASGRRFLRAAARDIRRADSVTCVAYPEVTGLLAGNFARARATAACELLRRAGVRAKLVPKAGSGTSRRVRITVVR